MRSRAPEVSADVTVTTTFPDEDTELDTLIGSVTSSPTSVYPTMPLEDKA